MVDRELHSWTLDLAEAVRVQERLRNQLILTWDGREIKTVAGVDIGLTKTNARAAVVVLNYPDLSPVDSATAEVPLVFRTFMLTVSRTCISRRALPMPKTGSGRWSFSAVLWPAGFRSYLARNRLWLTG